MSAAPKRPVSVESAKSSVRVGVSRALAVALVTGFEQTSEEGHPLSQLQQIHLATMTVMAYSEVESALANLDFEADVLVPQIRRPV